jgi:hypothetical protein
MASPKSLDGVLTKRAHTTETFTEDYIADLVKCMDPDNGYHFFMQNYFYIQHPVKGKMLFQPYPFQRDLLDSYHRHRFNVNMLPRQCGKCLNKMVNIRIKNKHTGELREIPIGEFFEMQRQNKK